MKPWFLRRLFAATNISEDPNFEWKWRDFMDYDSGYCLDRFTIDWQWECK